MASRQLILAASIQAKYSARSFRAHAWSRHSTTSTPTSCPSRRGRVVKGSCSIRATTPMRRPRSANFSNALAVSRSTLVSSTSADRLRHLRSARLPPEELGDSIEGQYGAPYYHFHRADLIALLAKAFGPKDIKLGRRLVDIEQDESGVTAHFQDGASERGDFLIGADGIHSRVRERLFGEEKPRFSGQIAYRGLAPAERVAHLRLPLDVTNWVGPDGHFVHYYVSAGRFLNFIAVSEEATWTRERWSDRGSISDAAKNYEGWHPQVATILTAVDERFKWALFDRNPLPEWTQGRVTLLGDACHPMLPFMAQGAAQAIEDGATLAACLKNTAFNVPTAFQAYVASRKPRTTILQERSL